MDAPETLLRYAWALAIGALVGLERHIASTREAVRNGRRSGEAEGEEGEGEGEADAGARRRSKAASEPELRAAVAAGEASAFEAAEPEREERPPSGRGETPRWSMDVRPAGFRTYTLIALSGAVAGTISTAGPPWVFPAAVLFMGGLILMSYFALLKRTGDPGITSEVALLIVFLLGGLCSLGQTVPAGAAAVVLTVILSFKRGLHGLVGRLREEDVHALLKFAVLTMVILPILPEEPVAVGHYLPGGEGAAAANGPVAVPPGHPVGEGQVELPTPGEGREARDGEPWWRGLEVSPRKVWYLVILISAVSFSGYVLSKAVGPGKGITLTGVVGGVASSTAVSLSFSQRSRDDPALSPQFATAILLANAIMPVRLLLLTALIAPALLVPLSIPLFCMVAVAGLAVLVLAIRIRAAGQAGAPAELSLKNPFELGPALKFGVIFGLVLFLAQVLQKLFGDAGLYPLAVLTGLTDVDAIGLALAGMVDQAELDTRTGVVLITLAAISNTVVKGGFVAVLGSERLRRIALLSFVLMIAGGAAGIAGVVLADGRLTGG